MNSNPNIWLPLMEAASRLCLNYHQTWFLVRVGTLESVKIGRTWLVDPASVSAYLEAQKAA